MNSVIPMIVLETPAVLLAGRSAGPPIQGGGLITWLILLGLAIAVICVTTPLASRWVNHLRRQSRILLFIGLCQTHGLGMRDWWLLWRVARMKGLSEPARLFIEADWLDPARLPGSLKPRAADVMHLRQRIIARGKATGQTSSSQPA